MPKPINPQLGVVYALLSLPSACSKELLVHAGGLGIISGIRVQGFRVSYGLEACRQEK